MTKYLVREFRPLLTDYLKININITILEIIKIHKLIIYLPLKIINKAPHHNNRQQIVVYMIRLKNNLILQNLFQIKMSKLLKRKMTKINRSKVRNINNKINKKKINTNYKNKQ